MQTAWENKNGLKIPGRWVDLLRRPGSHSPKRRLKTHSFVSPVFTGFTFFERFLNVLRYRAKV
jgi:hypothetical protein